MTSRSGMPEGIIEGTPVDVPMAINLGPLPLAAGTRYTWRLLVDGENLPGGLDLLLHPASRSRRRLARGRSEPRRWMP